MSCRKITHQHNPANPTQDPKPDCKTKWWVKSRNHWRVKHVKWCMNRLNTEQFKNQ